MNLYHQSVKTKSCLASDGHRTKNPEPTAIRYTRLKGKKWHGIKSQWKEKKDLNIQAWKSLWRTVAVSWGHIEQYFKHYKIKSPVYKHAVTERSVAIWQHDSAEPDAIYCFAHARKKGRLPDSLCGFTQEAHTDPAPLWHLSGTLWRTSGSRHLGSAVIPHWQLIVTQSKRPNKESTAALHTAVCTNWICVDPTNQTLSFSML